MTTRAHATYYRRMLNLFAYELVLVMAHITEIGSALRQQFASGIRTVNVMTGKTHTFLHRRVNVLAGNKSFLVTIKTQIRSFCHK